MVYGNYVLYGDRPSSESEIVDDHVHTSSIERKLRRKAERRMNGCLERNPSIDNETDSAECEKKVRVPRLLRYVPTSDVEENYVNNKFETYDLKASEQPFRRYNFTKKPKNPLDGSTNYAYSRSSSGCSSPASNLPTISETGEPNLHRVRPTVTATYEDSINVIEHKLDKYFTKPDSKDFVAKGTHPDSLFRVSAGYPSDRNKMVRWLRLMRWPIALIATCVALAVFVYFLMPDTMESGANVNGTYWEDTVPESHLYQLEAERKAHADEPTTASTTVDTSRLNLRASKTPEIDFYHTTKTIDFKTLKETVTEPNIKRKLPVPPVFPDHIAPEVVYGNEKVDTERLRKSKILHQQTISDDSTSRPHITQKPEKPLAIYFKEGAVVSTTTPEPISSSESISKYATYESKVTTKKPLTNNAPLSFSPIYKERRTSENTSYKPVLESELNSYSSSQFPENLNFTSGHSKIFGISIEHAEKMKATTPSSVYQTRVSPTLPTWRDQDTTTKFTSNFYADVVHCKSPQQHLCRGVLPYDLSGEPLIVNGVRVANYLPQLEYLVSTNCSERVRHFACALLEPECNPPPNPSKGPCNNFCREIIESCEGRIPQELMKVFNCGLYPKENCVAAKSPCYNSEFACGDGTCVPKEWACDGNIDCSDGDDEDSCIACDKSEFRCASGGCILQRWVCDGYADCLGGEDEADEACYPREVAAAAAPAPVVAHPTDTNARRVEHDSQEILMTSDSSNNALKQNFIKRRPSPHRLTPYTKPAMSNQNSTKHEESDDDQPTTFRAHKLTTKPNSLDRNTPLGDFRLYNLEREKKDEGQQKINGTNAMNDTVVVLDEEETNVTMPIVVRDQTLLNNVALLKKAFEELDSEDADPPPVSFHSLSAHASPCPAGELRCVDGRCITLAQLCDGVVDCSDHSDEDNCFT